MFELWQQVQFFRYCFACAGNVGSPTDFVVNDNAKVSVLMNLLSVTVFKTEIKNKGEKMMILASSK